MLDTIFLQTDVFLEISTSFDKTQMRTKQKAKFIWDLLTADFVLRNWKSHFTIILNKQKRYHLNLIFWR